MWVIFRLSIFLILMGYAQFSMGQTPSFGGFARELMEPVSILNSFISTAAWVIGGACLFASFLRYSQHKVNPLAMPLSSVIVLALLGIVLILLPFIYQLTGYEAPFPRY